MRPDLRTTPIRWGVVVASAFLSLIAAVWLVALASSEAGVPAPFYTSDVISALMWTLCGLLAWRFRPSSAIGRLMALLGLVLFVDAPVGWGLPAVEPRVFFVTTLGVLGFWFQWTIAAQILLTFPTGRAASHGERLFLWVAHSSAACVAIVQLLVESPDQTICGASCTASPIQLVHSRELFVSWRHLSLLWFAGLAVWLITLVARRARSGGRRWRRQRLVVAVSSAAVAAAAALYFLLSIVQGRPPWLVWVSYTTSWAVTVLVPGAFLLGLLRDRAGYVSVADLVRGLDRIEPPMLEEALARSLQDPSLRLLFPVGESGSFVDVEGTPVAIEDADPRYLTMLGSSDAPMAALLHDPVLNESPRLLESAASAARLSLHNARLQAEVRAQLAEVRASRARIVAAADEERQRLERNLHDGAQQRLVGLGMTLSLMRAEIQRDGKSTEYLDEAQTELLGAIRELRELAQGIHPAVLSDEGLVAGIGVLARRMPFRVVLNAEIPHRPPPTVETAAYYIVSEALQNVAKHARASSAVVHVKRVGDRLELAVTDDGVGGASSATGTGLRGIADRALALEGTFELFSPPGQGTHLVVTLPCA